MSLLVSLLSSSLRSEAVIVGYKCRSKESKTRSLQKGGLECDMKGNIWIQLDLVYTAGTKGYLNSFLLI